MEVDLSRAFDALPAMVWTARPDGYFDFANRGWSDYTGLSGDEAHGLGWQAAVNPDDLPGLLERWQSILASGEPGELEARVRRFDGQYRRFAVKCSPMRDDAGGIAKWCGVGTDVEDVLHAQDILRRRELDFQLIVDSIPVPVAVTEPSGEVEGLNQLTLDYFGRTFEELKGWKASDVVHPDDLEPTVAAQLEAHQMGISYNVESRHRRADGAYRWHNVVGLPLRDKEGRILRWFHLLIDVDDRKRVEEALRESERESRLIVDNMPTLVSLLTPAGGVELINRQILEYTGRTMEELKRWGSSDLVHPDDLSRAVESFKTGMSTGAPFDIVYRMRRFDGHYRWFDARHSPLRDTEGHIIRWCVTVNDIDDRMRAEDALRTSERNLKLTIDTIPALAWSARPDGSAEFLSQHYLDYVGLSAEQAQGWGWTATVHPDDLGGLSATWQAIMASGRPGEAEARLRRFDGEYRWLLFRTSPLRDASGSIVKWYGVNTDIDDRKQAEANLAREKHLLEMIASGSPLRDVLSELCGVVEEAGPGCYCDVHPIDWSGPRIEYSVAPSLPASYTDPIAGLSLSSDALPCAIAVRQKIQVVAEDMDTDPRWRDSSVRTHVLEHGLRSVWSTPIFAKDGQILGTLCLYQRQAGSPSPRHQDLIAHATRLASIAIERSRTEAALRRSEMLLAEGQKLSSTGSFSWHVDTDELAFSEELCRIFEFDPNATVTLEQVRARIHPEDVPLLSAQMAQVRAGQGYLGYEIRLRFPDDRVKYLRTFGRSVRHQDGRLECLAAVQDITERRLSEEALSKARSDLAHVTRVTSLGALTASIAHEVNQPLSGIITNASTCLRMLAANPPNIEVAQETARRTIRDGNRAADVIARLRTLFSKRTVGIEPIDLNEAAREVIALSSGELQRSRVVVRTELAEGLPPVGGDRIQLQQVIMNLLRNAMDAMSDVHDRARRLVIRTDFDSTGQVRLSLQDSGVGFGPDETERLFEAFYTTKRDGMGIGLSVSRTIIESHQGRLWADPNEGPGATFSFSIPEHMGEENPVPEAGLPAPVASNAQSSAGNP